MRKNNTQESEDEWWARLDKWIERVRARHELTRLGMGTIFLVVEKWFPLKSERAHSLYLLIQLDLLSLYATVFRAWT